MRKLCKNVLSYVYNNCTWRLAWYLTIVTALTIYILRIWDYAISFALFRDSNFDGNNLLFVVWIITLLSPIIRFEFKGTKAGLDIGSDKNAFIKKADDVLVSNIDFSDIDDKLSKVKGAIENELDK